MDYIKPVVNYRFELFERPLTKGQFSQLAIGIDTSSFHFWKLHTPLINFIWVRKCGTAGWGIIMLFKYFTGLPHNLSFYLRSRARPQNLVHHSTTWCERSLSQGPGVNWPSSVQREAPPDHVSHWLPATTRSLLFLWPMDVHRPQKFFIIFSTQYRSNNL